MKFYSSLLVSLLLVISQSSCEAEDDYYDILGIERSASSYEIKKAYRKKALKEHPDTNRDDPGATERFQRVNRAYEVLSDEDKRKAYDKCGVKCVEREGAMDNSDPFASFFGDFGFSFGGEDRGPRDTPKGGTITMDLFVTLEELYSGNFIEITRNKPVMKPASGTRKCNCRQEMVARNLGPGRFQMMQQTVCDECPNVKMVDEERLLEVEVEVGMVDGQETTFFAEGEPHLDGDPGDLKLKIRTMPHPVFERRGDDLYTNITISLQDALTGFTVEIPHLDGHKVVIMREKVTWPGARIRKKNEGMPNYENNNQKGVLYITFDVEFPKQEFTEEEKENLQKLLNQSPNNRVYNGLNGS
ncbi:dnaJ homolog shv [Contarinia nasturtii]|uniref:dnaJ homolog shv n=1 Tax=Contarinia nasturtii TaxID=265458 RepID=UPI0012D38F67|nr:dnaJ homolog shv [Contarinia nasturtii]